MNCLFIKNILMYPDTIILKFKRTSHCSYVLLIFGTFGSVSTNINAKLIINFSKNFLCMIYNKSINNLSNTLAFSEVNKINNIMFILHTGYWTTLRIVGVGYKVQHCADSSQFLSMVLGFSHPINCIIPKNIDVVIKKKTIKLWSSSYSVIRNFSYKLFLIKRKVDNYKCKGVIPAGMYKKLKIGKISRV